MKPILLLAAATLALLMSPACGNDEKSGPTSHLVDPTTPPAPTLVGTWEYTGQNFAARMTANIRDYLSAAGVPDSAAAEIADELVNAASFVDIPSITFSRDGTLTVNDPAGETAGTWQASEDMLTMVIAGEEYPPLTYEISKNETLKLSMPIENVKALMLAEEGVDRELVDVLFRGLESLTFGFKRAGK